MVEVQFHGFAFEQWVRDTFFEGYDGSYMQKWDVPAHASRSSAVPDLFRQLPVSIKIAKCGSAIGLGDALRQRRIAEPFLMIVGFWRQRAASDKWIEEIGVAHFSAEAWDSMWGMLNEEELRHLDQLVKDTRRHYAEVRQSARAWKRTCEALKTSAFVINPKIDSKSQRRVQCSLPFTRFWAAAGRSPMQEEAPSLFGCPFPNPIRSGPRVFDR